MEERCKTQPCTGLHGSACVQGWPVCGGLASMRRKGLALLSDVGSYGFLDWSRLIYSRWTTKHPSNRRSNSLHTVTEPAVKNGARNGRRPKHPRNEFAKAYHALPTCASDPQFAEVCTRSCQRAGQMVYTRPQQPQEGGVGIRMLHPQRHEVISGLENVV
jgi:hypothetical protein